MSVNETKNQPVALTDEQIKKHFSKQGWEVLPIQTFGELGEAVRSLLFATSQPERWVDTRCVHLDRSILMGESYDWDGWECSRLEMHTPHASFAVWPHQLGGKQRWSMYCNRDGLLMFERFGSKKAAQAEAEMVAESLAASAPQASQPSARDDELAKVQAALEANHKWHVANDTYSAYDESELAEQTMRAIAAIRALRQQAPAVQGIVGYLVNGKFCHYEESAKLEQCAMGGEIIPLLDGRASHPAPAQTAPVVPEGWIAVERKRLESAHRYLDLATGPSGVRAAFEEINVMLSAVPSAPAVQGGLVHTDHPIRHFDRTCPACNAEASHPAPAQTGEKK